MKQRLIDILNTFGYPVYLQGSLNPDIAYPDSFITYWTDYTADNAHYDDAVASVDWSFSVMFYSNNPNLVDTVPQAISAVLRASGYIPQGKGQDLISNEITHTGWVTEYIYTENL